MIVCVREGRKGRTEGRKDGGKDGGKDGRTESGGMAANKIRTPHRDVGKKRMKDTERNERKR